MPLGQQAQRPAGRHRDDVLPLGLERDEDGFGLDSAKARVAGVARRPADVATCVRDATGAAARALASGRA